MHFPVSRHPVAHSILGPETPLQTQQFWVVLALNLYSIRRTDSLTRSYNSIELVNQIKISSSSFHQPTVLHGGPVTADPTKPPANAFPDTSTKSIEASLRLCRMTIGDLIPGWEIASTRRLFAACSRVL